MYMYTVYYYFCFNSILIATPLESLLINLIPTYMIIMSYLQPFGAATLGKAGLIVIPILVSFSTFGAANGSIYITSRLIFSAARDNLLPDFLRGLYIKRRTPVPALILLVTTMDCTIHNNN